MLTLLVANSAQHTDSVNTIRKKQNHQNITTTVHKNDSNDVAKVHMHSAVSYFVGLIHSVFFMTFLNKMYWSPGTLQH